MTARYDAMVNAALIALGALAIFDNVVVHWLLEFHRFKDGWDGSVYVEMALVLVGAAMLTTGVIRERRVRRPPP